MDSIDYSFVADALLAMCGESAEHPFEWDSAPKQSPERVGQEWFVQLANIRRPADVLLMEECRAIVERAGLTENQASVLDLRLNGLSFEQIGKRRNRTRQAVMHHFLQAIKKIGRVMRVYPYAGLSDVYRYEVRRGSIPRTFGRMDAKVAMRPSR